MSVRRKNKGGVTEAEAIACLGRRLDQVPRGPGLELGIGDDAAVVVPPSKRLVCSIDASAEGVHFDLKWLTLGEAAARALVAAVSDLAAMGSKPVAALVNLEVPPSAGLAEFDAVGVGQRRAGLVMGCPIIGGNIVRGSRWVFTTSVMGSARRVIRRDGARPGDEIWLTGHCGLARIGLTLLQRGCVIEDLPKSLQRAAKLCIRTWKVPVARLEEGARLVGKATALIDVSDGLSSELRHIAESSSVRVVVQADALLATLDLQVQQLITWLKLEPLDVVLAGGEDYALLATGPAAARPPFVQVVGEVWRGKGAYVASAVGLRRLAAGFDHLR
jgi:thiamine-monophosphate kinase